jgi:hypothetical protein
VLAWQRHKAKPFRSVLAWQRHKAKPFRSVLAWQRHTAIDPKSTKYIYVMASDQCA